MIIKKTPYNKNYIRKIESMGDGLVLFNVSTTSKSIGQNYHLFYADKRKPPLDIAINPLDGMIEYISCFAQDEVVESNRIKNEITNKGIGISITHEDFNENNVHITIDSKFKFTISENNLWILRTDIDKCIFSEYGIDELNGLIFANNQFYGMVFKNLNEEELQEICNSNCLV